MLDITTFNTTEEAVIGHEDLNLEHLLSIWPIVSSIATQIPAGDLISLSRASSTCRAVTHGFSIENVPKSSLRENRHNFLDLRIGNHQTSYWATLKSLAPFSCSSPFHKEPRQSNAANNTTKPCRYCSRPVCKACIVRSFFADPSQSKNTFRYRTRYLCQKCWDCGNLRRDFRYPAENTSREHIWRGRSYGQRGGRCSCSASEDNWLCRGCRALQNISGPTNSTLHQAEQDSKAMIVKNREVSQDSSPSIPCYGLGCMNTIIEANRDKRRICLWCSRSLPRQYGGEERLRWEEKQLEIRAAAAAARSADIGEWARNRFKSLTMSRREMRGTEECIMLTGRDSPEHDQPLFVRHLDAVNYRKWIAQRVVPSPGSVYESKHGRWTYSRDFLIRFDGCDLRGVIPEHADPDFAGFIQQHALEGCRSNFELRAHMTDGPLGNIIVYGTHLQEAGLIDDSSLVLSSQMCFLSHSEQQEKLWLSEKLFEQLKAWENLDDQEKEQWQPVGFHELLLDLAPAEREQVEKLKSVRRQDEQSMSPGNDETNFEIGRARLERPAYMEQEEGPPPPA